MILNTYTIYDSASGAFMRPFFLLADEQAVRSFREIARDAENEVDKRQEDYSLVRCGTFDDQKGQLTVEKPVVLTTGIRIVTESRQIDSEKMRQYQQHIAKSDGADAPANGQTKKSLNEAMHDKVYGDPAT